MIYTENLTHRYGQSETPALDDLNLSIGKGEVFGLIGPNGAGKTTTLSILATILKPSHGLVEVGGFDLRRHPRDIRRVIGYMPDTTGVYADMTLEEYLRFFAAAADIKGSKATRVIEDVLELTDLTHKDTAPLQALSRGMRQRLGIARVLLHDPGVLLLDEPASGLDPRARIEMRLLLQELRTMGKTILISSHILSELAQICTHLGILEAGRLHFQGTVDELMTRCQPAVVVHVHLQEHILQPLDESDLPVEMETPPQPLAEKARDLLLCDPRVEEIQLAADHMEIHLCPSEQDSSFIPESLITNGFRIHHFARQPLSLEDAFLQITRGEVS